jgi:preprotein translocase subunit YajC
MTMVAASFFAMSAAADGGNPWIAVFPWLAILAIVYFVVLLPARRNQKKVEEFRQSLKVGDRVITTGGIYGQVTRLGEESVQLQIADKIKIEVAKASIGGHQGQAAVVADAAQ